MILNKDIKMADALLQNHFLIIILERFGISFGLEEKTIEEICMQYDINIDIFLSIANLHVNINSFKEVELTNNDIYKIVSYLKNSHEYYSKEVLPGISERIKLLCENSEDLSLILIERFFNEYISEVNKHLKNEETTVYPYALSLLKDNPKLNKYSISEYKKHHDDIETKLDDLKNLLVRHLPEKNDHKFRRNILFDLFRFEKDLVIHTIIEEQILIPQIERIENSLK